MLTWTWYFALSIIYWICSWYNALIDLGFRILEVLGIGFDMWGFGWRFGIWLLLLGLDLKYPAFVLLEKTRIVYVCALSTIARQNAFQCLARKHMLVTWDMRCISWFQSRACMMRLRKMRGSYYWFFWWNILGLLRVFGLKIRNIWKAWYLVCFKSFWALAEIEIHTQCTCW